jgi:hypothetical protein
LTTQYPGIWGTRVVPVGLKTPAEVAMMQQSALFTIAPSRWDTFNFTVAEAMARGRLALCSTETGASYLIEDGANGGVFDVADPIHLSRMIAAAHDMSHAERAQIGAAARATIASQLTPSAVAKASLVDLASIVGSRSPQPADWVRELFEPQGQHERQDDAHLEHVSIGALARHLGTRVTRKIVG